MISSNRAVSDLPAQVKAFLRGGHECLQVIQDALHQFKGTPEEVQVTVANAELAVQRGDLPAAIAELRWVLW